MTGGEFFTAIGIFYGIPDTFEGKVIRKPRQYDDVMGKAVASVIRVFIFEGGDCQALYDHLTSTVSANYAKLPDKAQMLEAIRTLPRKSVVVVDDDPKAPANLDEVYRFELEIKAIAARYGRPISDDRMESIKGVGAKE